MSELTHDAGVPSSRRIGARPTADAVAPDGAVGGGPDAAQGGTVTIRLFDADRTDRPSTSTTR